MHFDPDMTIVDSIKGKPWRGVGVWGGGVGLLVGVSFSFDLPIIMFLFSKMRFTEHECVNVPPRGSHMTNLLNSLFTASPSRWIYCPLMFRVELSVFDSIFLF